MTIEKNLDGQTLTMSLIGRLNTSTAPELESEIKDSTADANDLVLDFTELEYISSAGLRVILSAQKLMNAKGGSMVVKNVRDTVKEIFEVTGFSSIITIE